MPEALLDLTPTLLLPWAGRLKRRGGENNMNEYRMKQLLFYIIINFIFITSQMSSSQVKNTSLDNFNWMLDNWVTENEYGITRERWVKESDTILRGISFTIKNGDTVFTEKLSIEKRNDEIYYVAIVEHNPGPVDFKLTSLTGSKAVFENPDHDFPQKITYNNEEDGSLYAQVVGRNKDGKVITIEFLMKKER